MEFSEIAVGSGAAATGLWFADKLLGPSAEAVGDQLKVYLQSRCPAIFGRAGEIAQAKDIEPGPIKPGLLARLIMDASFSEETEEITEWWANLILDASISGSNKHAVFSDMMAMIGPIEAKCLQDFIQSFPSAAVSEFGETDLEVDILTSRFEFVIGNWIGDQDIGERNAEITSAFLNRDPGWPMRPTEWRLPLKEPDGEIELVYGFNAKEQKNLMTFSILQRAGILSQLSATFSVWGGTMWVKGIGLTPLGHEFYGTCTGKKLPSSTTVG